MQIKLKVRFLNESAFVSKVGSVRDIIAKLKIKEMDKDKWTKMSLDDLERYITMSRKVGISPRIVYGKSWFVFIGAGWQRGYGYTEGDINTIYNNIVLFTVVPAANLKPKEDIDPNIMHISRFSSAQEIFVPAVKELRKPLEKLLSDTAKDISSFDDYMDIQKHFNSMEYRESLQKMKRLGELCEKKY